MFRVQSSKGEAQGRALAVPLYIYLFIYFLFFVFLAAPSAYGSSQARGRIGAVTVGLRHSHSNARSKPSLQPTPQLTATLDP